MNKRVKQRRQERETLSCKYSLTKRPTEVMKFLPQGSLDEIVRLASFS